MSANLTTNSGSGYSIAHAGTTILETATQITVLGWAYPTSLIDLQPLACHRNDPNNGWSFHMSGTLGNILVKRERTSADFNTITNDTPIVTLNKWYKLAATMDTGVTPWGHIYVGDLTTPLAERTYGTQTNGAGTNPNVTVGTPVGIGVWPGLTNRWRGRVAEIAVFDRILTVAQMEDWFQHSRGMDANVYISLCKVAAATVNQPDWGRFGGITTTVHGTPVLADHVPLGRFRRAQLGWRGNVPGPPGRAQLIDGRLFTGLLSR